MTKLNLNADMGESFGVYKMGDDAGLVAHVQSANVACGFHGGDPLVMQNCMRLCLDRNVSIGAHPSFQDLHGFGRREMVLPADEIRALLTYQIGAAQAMAARIGSRLRHVKPHGALNNMACRDGDLAQLICQTLYEMDQDVILLAPAVSELSAAGYKSGLCVVEEIYADRAYEDDASLMSRKKPGAVLHDLDEILTHITSMIEAQAIISHSGKKIPCQFQSICVHGDNPQAMASARHVAASLKERGIELVDLPSL